MHVTGVHAQPSATDFTPGSLFAERYRIRALLSAGGGGAVYLADQLEPVRRQVAIKVIQAGRESRHLEACVEQEGEILALMDHPNLAKVYDAGVADGMPYFVGEYVQGLSITRYCDDARLTLKQRLELFVPLCQAIQHAHQKGILHRDLKPSNVLVTLHEGRPVTKVIDFGVAKAAGPRLTDVSVLVEPSTLENASPEQLEVNNLDIDIRTDVYALGIILYELLTGSAPFAARNLGRAGFAEMLRRVKEVEPPRPSTRLAASPALASIAARRQTDPRKLTRLVRGDLDCIVMKALMKDRKRRYGTAIVFSQDVERFLGNHAVVARPPSRVYRLRKFVHRNKGLALAASLAWLALLGGVVGATWGMLRAEAAREAAVHRAEAEREARPQSPAAVNAPNAENGP